MKKLVLLLLFGNIFFTTFGQSFKVICSDIVGRNQVFNMKIVSDIDTSLYKLDVRGFNGSLDFKTYISIDSLEPSKEYNFIIPNELLEFGEFYITITNIITRDSISNFKEVFTKFVSTYISSLRDIDKDNKENVKISYLNEHQFYLFVGGRNNETYTMQLRTNYFSTITEKKFKYNHQYLIDTKIHDLKLETLRLILKDDITGFYTLLRIGKEEE